MPKQHVVKQGECLPQIARKYGFADARLVYDHPSNAELRRKRPDPNVLFPGDRVTIPDAVPKQEPARTGRTHKFVFQRGSKRLRLVLQDSEGKPLAGAGYTLEFKSAHVVTGQTGGDGLVEAPVPEASAWADLLIEGRRLRLRFGHLNPLRDVPDKGVTGARARLHNLGYAVAEAGEVLDASLRVALAAFQADQGLTVDGELSPATLSRLEEVHGC